MGSPGGASPGISAHRRSLSPVRPEGGPPAERRGTPGGSTELQRVPSHARPVPDGRKGGAGRYWLAVCALSIIVADDYKFRVRDPRDTLSGGVDIFVVLELAVYGAVACYLLLTMRGVPRVRRVPPVIALAGAYVILLVVSLIHAPFLSLAAARCLQVVILFGLTLAAASRATRGDLHRFAHGFLVLVAASVVFGLVVHMPKFPQQEARFTWLRIHPVTAGVFAGLATILALTYLVTFASKRPGPHWPRWVYLALLALVGGGLLGTQTRGALVGAVAGAVVLGGLRYRGRRRIEVVFMTILVGSIAATWGGARLAAYFARGETVSQLATISDRTGLWSLAWGAIQQQPVFGWGTGASRGIFLDETGLGGGHNALVNVAVDLGAIGVLVWVSLLLTLVITTWRFPVTGAHGIACDRALILSVVAFLVVDGGTFEGLGAMANESNTWLFVLVAWVAVLSREISAGPVGRAHSVLPWRLTSAR